MDLYPKVGRGKTKVKNLKPKIVLALTLIAVVAAIVFAWPKKDDQNKTSNLDSFAQCLADKGITMYGAYWCPHCQNEKKAFGDSWKFVPYVECTEEPQKCLDAGIKSYPTWVWPDGKKLVGEQGIGGLAKESGCSLQGTEN